MPQSRHHGPASDLESMLVDPQARDPPVEGLPRHAQSLRCTGGPRNTAACRPERRFDHLPFPIDEGCVQRTGRCGCTLTSEPGLVDAERLAIGQDDGPLNDVLELSNVTGPGISLQQI